MADGSIVISPIDTSEQLADILTKTKTTWAQEFYLLEEEATYRLVIFGLLCRFISLLMLPVSGGV